VRWHPRLMSIIDVRNLQKRYGNTVAVEDVSFTVEAGEIFGILGPNGAGKTTTVECIEGLRAPDQGTISVLGRDPARDGAALRELVGAQLQDSQLPEKLQVREALDLYRSFYRAPANVERLVEALGLTHVLDRRFAKLSGGERQRLSIALALIGGPLVAVLDELTTGLDPAARRDTWALIEGIRDQGVTILLVTHFMEEAERLCDRVAVIDAGRVVAIDTPDALAAGVQAEQRIRFRTATELDDRLLADLPEVASVERAGDQVVVTGNGEALAAVTAALARNGIVVQQLRVEQANLEDAFVALTGKEVA
jgi:ABC-2 type transport system ATP-binding protein